MKDEIVEPNRSQRQSDAPHDDAVASKGFETPAAGRESTANGVPAGDENEGKQRRKQYHEGADLVSRID